MKNVYTRLLAATVAETRPFIENAWSGTDRDVFPRDVIQSWRKNPPDVPRGALVPGKTRLGHGIFRFRLVEWTGDRWRVEIDSSTLRGWHGFELADEGGRCRITHTLEVEPSLTTALVWPVTIEPIHDWARGSALRPSRRRFGHGPRSPRNQASHAPRRRRAVQAPPCGALAAPPTAGARGLAGQLVEGTSSRVRSRMRACCTVPESRVGDRSLSSMRMGSMLPMSILARTRRTGPIASCSTFA